MSLCYRPVLAIFGAFAFQACGSPDAVFSSSGYGGDAGSSGVGSAPYGGSSGATHAGSGATGEVSGGDAGAAGEPGLSGGGTTDNGGSAGDASGAAGRAGSGGGHAGGGGTSPHGGSGGAGGSFGGGGVGGSLSGGGGTLGGAGSGGQPNPVCGNAVRESGEQCDDGNTIKLDGCSEACRFEQSLRSNWFKVKFLPDALCQSNAFGSAFSTAGRVVLQQALDARVASGNFNLLFAFASFGDLTGTTELTLSVGVLDGQPTSMVNYDGTHDLDFWYTARANNLNANRSPLFKLSGSITANVLSAGPGVIQLPLLSASPLKVWGAQLQLPLGATLKPLTSAGGPPGHLPSEHLNPTLTSFATAGEPTSTGSGELCGNISAASLANEAIPVTYTDAGDTPCDEGYGPENSFLDVLVGGCTIGSAELLSSTQPDQVNPATPEPGAGAPFRLTANGSNVVNRCRDSGGQTVPLATCLTAVGYSSAYRLTADRVIIK